MKRDTRREKKLGRSHPQSKTRSHTSSHRQRSPHSQARTQNSRNTSGLIPDLFDQPAELVRHHVPHIIARRSHFIVVNKPSGWLTHSDGRDEGEGRPDLVSWGRSELGLALRVHQRLDVSTSGVIAFSLDSEGDRILGAELSTSAGGKYYLAVVEGTELEQVGRIDRPVPKAPKRQAITDYKVLRRGQGWTLLEVKLLTGRTHQIRAHLASEGAPIRGDGRYGDPFDLRAPRTLLHASRLIIRGEMFEAEAPPCFARYLADQYSDIGITALQGRVGLDRPGDLTCYRLFNGSAEGFPGWRVDRYGDWLWVIQDQGSVAGPLPDGFQGVYRLNALVDRSQGEQARPSLWRGDSAPNPLIVYEAGVRYAVELGEQLSTGLFLDQRPQRAWLARMSKPVGRVLNTFAHAGGFSIASGYAGSETVSIDLSGRWLSRIPRQLEVNDLDPRQHRCLTGDVFDWLRRLTKRGERFDLIILDPPSTSVGKKKKRWSAARDYPELIKLALPLLSPGGRMMTSTNHRKLTPRKFARLTASVLSPKEGYRLERVCAPGVDFPTDDPLSVKNLIWRAPH